MFLFTQTHEVLTIDLYPELHSGQSMLYTLAGKHLLRYTLINLAYVQECTHDQPTCQSHFQSDACSSGETETPV